MSSSDLTSASSDLASESDPVSQPHGSRTQMCVCVCGGGWRGGGGVHLMKPPGRPVIDWCQNVIIARPSGSCQAQFKPTTGDVHTVSFDVARMLSKHAFFPPQKMLVFKAVLTGRRQRRKWTVAVRVNAGVLVMFLQKRSGCWPVVDTDGGLRQLIHHPVTTLWQCSPHILLVYFRLEQVLSLTNVLHCHLSQWEVSDVCEAAPLWCFYPYQNSE